MGPSLPLPCPIVLPAPPSDSIPWDCLLSEQNKHRLSPPGLAWTFPSPGMQFPRSRHSSSFLPAQTSPSQGAAPSALPPAPHSSLSSDPFICSSFLPSTLYKELNPQVLILPLLQAQPEGMGEGSEVLGPPGEIRGGGGAQGSQVRRKQSQEVSGLRWGQGISRRKSEVTSPTPRVWWANRKFLFVAKQHFHHSQAGYPADQAELAPPRPGAEGVLCSQRAPLGVGTPPSLLAWRAEKGHRVHWQIHKWPVGMGRALSGPSTPVSPGPAGPCEGPISRRLPASQGAPVGGRVSPQGPGYKERARRPQRTFAP